MKNRIFFLFLFILLTITFILTGAYYILVLIILLISLILVSLFSMLCFSNQISIKIIDNKENTNFIYESKGFPLGKLSIDLNVENLFYEETYQSQFELILCNKQIITKLSLNKSNIGKYKVNEQSYILSDFLGLFKKKIKKQIISEMIQYPKLNHLNDSQKVSEEVIAYQTNKSEDYDIREYRIGDSLKDIHYKMSYKLNHYMIKEKYNNKGNNISVYLDLSGSNDECEKVFSNLNVLIENLQAYHETCLVKWVSVDEIYEHKVTDLKDLKKCMQLILSMPKCKEKLNISSTWVITPFGLK